MASRIATQSLWKGVKQINNFGINRARFSLHSSKYISSTLRNNNSSKNDTFSIKEILPPQDAFAKRHIGPRKQERMEMLEILKYNVSFLFNIIISLNSDAFQLECSL